MSIDWANFTPWQSLAGGILIGASAALLYLASGRIAGISGIVGSAIRGDDSQRGWCLAFIAGLLAAPAAWSLLAPPGAARIGQTLPASGSEWGVIAVAGLLVGFGTRMANGCTSGHGICGLARLSVRSLAAVLAFMASGFATVFVVRHVVGG